jgi:hypothetical protein
MYLYVTVIGYRPTHLCAPRFRLGDVRLVSYQNLIITCLSILIGNLGSCCVGI